MYGASNHGGDDGNRLKKNVELERLREQSKLAIEKASSRIEKLSEEQRRISVILEEKESLLRKCKNAQSSRSLGSINNASGSTEKRRESTGWVIDEPSNHGSLSHRNEFDDDMRIHLMIQERDERIQEIEEIMLHKETLLRSLQEETQEQQETIQVLQKELEGLQATSASYLHSKVTEKERDVAELEEELEKLQNDLTEMERNRLELEEEWNDREDVIADAELEVQDKLDAMREKLERYTSEIERNTQIQEQLKDQALQRIQVLEQELMEYIPPDSRRSMMKQLHESFEGLQQKEKELARALVRRLDERKALIPPALRLQILDRQCANVVEKLATISKVVDAKIRLAQDRDDSDSACNLLMVTEDQVSQAIDEVLQEMGIRLDNLEQDLFEDEDETVETVMRSLNKLNFSIQARFRQMLGSLPDSPIDQVEEEDSEMNRRSSREGLRIHSLQSSLTSKKEELTRIENEQAKVEVQADNPPDDNSNNINILEEELELMSLGLREKDRMISTINNITKERRDAEAYLIEELHLAYKKGLVHESDFGDSDQTLYKKLWI